MIAKVISGGQTGVDEAALRAAKVRGVPTGGFMPKGFRTLAGPRPDFAQLYGMVELPYKDYPPRTKANVESAALTIRIASVWLSPGEVATLRAILRAEKPYCDIRVHRHLPGSGSDYVLAFGTNDISTTVEKIRQLAEFRTRPIVVNIAGNSDRIAPGIDVIAEKIVGEILEASR